MINYAAELEKFIKNQRTKNNNQIIKNDTNNDGKLDNSDEIALALTSPEGLNYVEIDSGLSAVIDHRINSDASELTVLYFKRA